MGDAVQIVRFVAWTLEFACCMIAVHYIVAAVTASYALDFRHRIRVAIGLAVKSFGWGLHQFYWWLWQVAGDAGRMDLKATFESWAQITILAYFVIFAGQTLVISPWTERVAGNLWPAFGLGIVAGLMMLGALMRAA